MAFLPLPPDKPRPARGPLSENVQLDDQLDIATVYGVKICGELLRCLGEPTAPGKWFRVVAVEGGVASLEERFEAPPRPGGQP